MPIDPASRLNELLDELEPAARVQFLTITAGITQPAIIRQVAEALAQGAVQEALGLASDGAAAYANIGRTIFQGAGARSSEYINANMTAPNVHVAFDVTNDRAVSRMRTSAAQSAREFSAEQVRATRLALTDGMTRGLNPRQQARAFRQSIGLTERQQAAVINYRRLLTEDPHEALTRALRDKRFDRTVRSAAAGRRAPLTSREVDTMTERYRQRYLIYRSEVVARTEALRGVHEANVEAYEQAFDRGVLRRETTVQTWIPARDERTRDSHAAMSGQQVAIGQPFTSGDGNLLRYPGDTAAPPEETIQCRCAVTTRTEVPPEERTPTASAATMRASRRPPKGSTRTTTAPKAPRAIGGTPTPGPGKPAPKAPRRPASEVRGAPIGGTPTPRRSASEVRGGTPGVRPSATAAGLGTRDPALPKRTITGDEFVAWNRGKAQPGGPGNPWGSEAAPLNSALEHWNKHVGMSLDDMEKALLKGMPKDYSLGHLHVGDVGNDVMSMHFSLRQQLPDGTYREAGNLLRVLDFKAGVAHHSMFTLENWAQGADLGKPLLRNSVDMWRKLGLKELSTTANIDVGGYAWAKYGYKPTASGWDRLQMELHDRLRSLATDPDVPKDLLALAQKFASSSNPQALWDLADMQQVVSGKALGHKGPEKLGKQLLLGTTWDGELQFSDHLSMQRFGDYVGKTKA